MSSLPHLTQFGGANQHLLLAQNARAIAHLRGLLHGAEKEKHEAAAAVAAYGGEIEQLRTALEASSRRTAKLFDANARLRALYHQSPPASPGGGGGGGLPSLPGGSPQSSVGFVPGPASASASASLSDPRMTPERTSRLARFPGSIEGFRARQRGVQPAELLALSHDESQAFYERLLTGGRVERQERVRDFFFLAKQYQQLATIATNINACDDDKRAIDGIIQGTYELVQCERVTLFLVDEHAAPPDLYFAVAKDAKARQLRIPINNRSIAGCVAATGEPVNIPDAYEDPRFNSDIDRITGFTTRNILCVPVLDHDKNCVGVIQALNKLTPAEPATRTMPRDGADAAGAAPTPRHARFSTEDETLLGAMAWLAGTQLRTLRLLESALAGKRASDAVLQMAELVGSGVTSGADHVHVVHKLRTIADTLLRLSLVMP